MKLKIVKINREGAPAKPPSKATEGSAGYDLYAAIASPLAIEPKGLVSVPTGIAVGFPCSRYVGLIYARSGLAVRHGIALSNGVGVIDSDYTGEIIVGLCNLSDKAYTLEPGERFAQLLIFELPPVDIELTDDIDLTARNSAGFGSTGRF